MELGMKVDVLTLQGEVVRTAELPDGIFSAPGRPDLMHQALVRQQAHARPGTHKTQPRSEGAGGGRLVVVEERSVSKPRPRKMAELLGRLGGGSTLILLAKPDINLEKSARNLPDAQTLPARYLHVQDLVGCERVS